MEIKISEAEGNSEREDICKGKGNMNMRSARAMSKKVEKKNGFGVSGGKYRRMKKKKTEE